MESLIGKLLVRYSGEALIKFFGFLNSFAKGFKASGSIPEEGEGKNTKRQGTHKVMRPLPEKVLSPDV
ncbi:hypothetical protein [Maridesulfovibrio sp.]|uniref:hypothetical protein n=1 Tax=Maridesulfovibrio sp. TaxID=2795000 RepID=UPI0029CAA847|nr:hypothetical protein [Maridesulfovibrio sp.]